MTTGWVYEIFRSVQGEGIYAGALQVFVRFCGCAADCVYCDTVAARSRRRDCVCSTGEGRVLLENPIGADAAATLALSLAAATPGLHSLAVTGGEPLDQADFLVELLEAVGRCKIPRYLETNGLDPEAARRAEPLVEYVALDLKLPSQCGGRGDAPSAGSGAAPTGTGVAPDTGSDPQAAGGGAVSTGAGGAPDTGSDPQAAGGDSLAAGAESCRIFRRRGLFCKVVLTDQFDAEEFQRTVSIVAEIDAGIPFIIQPATAGANCAPPSPLLLIECAMQAGRRLSTVRVVPQIHPLLGLP